MVVAEGTTSLTTLHPWAWWCWAIGIGLAVSGTTNPTCWRSTVTRALTAEPGRHRPSVLAMVARATVLWLAVAVPGNTRSSVVCVDTPSLRRVTVTGTPAPMC